MLLYRGITVPSDEAMKTVEQICRTGSLASAGRTAMAADYLKPRLDELWQLPVLTREATLRGDGTTWICACADEGSATYYACDHNRSKTDRAPILVTFEVDLVDVIVDATDFLFTLFQLGDADRARPWAERLFGGRICRYLDRAYKIEDGLARIPICHLAVQDDAIVSAHAENRIVIGGRMRTVFCTAFMVRSSVPADRIVDVREFVEPYVAPQPEVTLQMIR